MAPYFAAVIVLVTTGLFVWALDSFLNALWSFRRTRPWGEADPEIDRAP